MVRATENLYLKELSRQRLIIGALVVLIVVVGAVSRNQRELFGGIGSEVHATAFAAVAPFQEVNRIVENSTPLFTPARLRLPRRPAGAIPVTEAEARAPDLGVSVGPVESTFVEDVAAPIAPIGEAPELTFADPIDLASPPLLGVVGNAPPNNATNPPNPGGGAVPEPATWITLILGFFAIGWAMRRSKYVALRSAH